MDNQSFVLSPVPVTELINAISSDVLAKLSALIHQERTPTPEVNKDNLLTRFEVAKLLGISLVTLHKYTVAGVMPAYRIHGSRKVHYKEIEVRQALTKIKTIASDARN